MSETRWFTTSLTDAQAMKHPMMGFGYLFGEGRPGDRFNDFGINVRVVDPGQPTAMYHSENAEEAFLILGGKCLAIVDDEEVELGQWDFLHCPPDTAHVLVGAGDGPCTILMVGARREDKRIHYPVSEKAARYGVSVKTPTDSPREAWEQVGLEFEFELAALPWPP